MQIEICPLLTGVREQGKGKSSVSVSAEGSWKGREILGCTVKKVIGFPVPSREVTNQTLLDGNRESLVSDFPAGDGKIGNLFSVRLFFRVEALFQWRKNKYIEAKPGYKP